MSRSRLLDVLNCRIDLRRTGALKLAFLCFYTESRPQDEWCPPTAVQPYCRPPPWQNKERNQRRILRVTARCSFLICFSSSESDFHAVACMQAMPASGAGESKEFGQFRCYFRFQLHLSSSLIRHNLLPLAVLTGRAHFNQCICWLGIVHSSRSFHGTALAGPIYPGLECEGHDFCTFQLLSLPQASCDGDP